MCFIGQGNSFEFYFSMIGREGMFGLGDIVKITVVPFRKRMRGLGRNAWRQLEVIEVTQEKCIGGLG